MGRIVIATAEFAPMPPLQPGYPDSDGHRMRFLRHDGIYRSDVVQHQTQEPNPGNGPNRLPPVGPEPG